MTSPSPRCVPPSYITCFHATSRPCAQHIIIMSHVAVAVQVLSSAAAVGHGLVVRRRVGESSFHWTVMGRGAGEGHSTCFMPPFSTARSVLSHMSYTMLVPSPFDRRAMNIHMVCTLDTQCNIPYDVIPSAVEPRPDPGNQQQAGSGTTPHRRFSENRPRCIGPEIPIHYHCSLMLSPPTFLAIIFLLFWA